MQFVAFDVADDFAVEADLVQVSAAVVEVIDMAAVGQDGADAVAQRVVLVAYGGALSVFGLLRMCRLLLNRFGALKSSLHFFR